MMKSKYNVFKFVIYLMLVSLISCSTPEDFRVIRVHSDRDLKDEFIESRKESLTFAEISDKYDLDEDSLNQIFRLAESSDNFQKCQPFNLSSGQIIPIKVENERNHNPLYLYYNQNFKLLIAVELNLEYPENILYINNSEELSKEVDELINSGDHFILNVVKTPDRASGIQFKTQ